MKYALVTGGSRGIGRAICLRLADMGYNILINYVSNDSNAQEVLDLVRAKGVSSEVLKFDVGNPTDVAQSLNTWIEKNPQNVIEILVNNAGIRKDGLMMFMSDEDWNGVMNANIGGFFTITRIVIKNMIRNRYGRVINIVSLSGLKGLPGQTNYSASKAAVIGATKALSQEIGKKNITVNAIAPGYIRTEMIQEIREDDVKSSIPMNRFGEPEEVADLAGFLASKNASYISGQVISINGGLYA
jgi:3-oxoacyl-[acyl-carrier protein] reductase